MTKEQYNFKLSEAAVKAIETILKKDDLVNNKTGAVEAALISYAKHLKAKDKI